MTTTNERDNNINDKRKITTTMESPEPSEIRATSHSQRLRAFCGMGTSPWQSPPSSSIVIVNVISSPLSLSHCQHLHFHRSSTNKSPRITDNQQCRNNNIIIIVNCHHRLPHHPTIITHTKLAQKTTTNTNNKNKCQQQKRHTFS